MKKGFKKLGVAMSFVLCATMAVGCSKSTKKMQEDMIDKYASYCQLGEYKDIAYEKTETEITDEVISSQVNYYLSSYAVTESVTTGTTKNGDTVNIDFLGTVDGVAFDGGSTDGMGYTLTLGAGTMIDGFEEQIVGHDVGETFDIEVTFPENYGNAELAGVDAVFEITINSIEVSTLPDYNDDFIAANTDYATVAEFEQAITDSIKESDDSANKTAIIDKIIATTTIEKYPEKEMQKLIDTTIKEVTDEASSYGYDLATYVSARYGMSEEYFRNYVSGVAEDFMQEKIVICAIADAEGITVTEDE